MSAGAAFLAESAARLRTYKGMADRALAQVGDEAFFAGSPAAGNSLAVLVKHLAGSTRSRWTDFLTSDGEKADRNRDGEFVIGEGDTRESLTAFWDDAWERLLAALEGLAPEDLERTVAIRGEPHTVPAAILRQLAHSAYHVGQIVQLAKHHAGDSWETLSVPWGQSEQFTARMRAKHSR